MTALDWFLVVTAVCFWAIVINANRRFPQSLLAFLRARKQRKAAAVVADFIERMKDEGNRMAVEAGREVSEFRFRGRDGKLDSVNIVIDARMDGLGISPDQFRQMMTEGNAGALDDLLNQEDKQEEVATTKEFVFSAKSVRDMRQAGIEPDEIVAKILKSAGRMA